IWMTQRPFRLEKTRLARIAEESHRLAGFDGNEMLELFEKRAALCHGVRDALDRHATHTALDARGEELRAEARTGGGGDLAGPFERNATGRLVRQDDERRLARAQHARHVLDTCHV